MDSLKDSLNDDMMEARALAEEHGYHQRSPSMMIVVPLEDGDGDGLYCDELNASYFDFFQETTFDQYEYNNGDDKPPPLVEVRVESPRSVTHDIFAQQQIEGLEALNCGQQHPEQRKSSSLPFITTNPHSGLPIITDLIQQQSSFSNISAARRSCHRRSRNRALTSTEFERNVLPNLQEDFLEDVAATSSSLLDLPLQGRISENEVEC